MISFPNLSVLNYCSTSWLSFSLISISVGFFSLVQIIIAISFRALCNGKKHWFGSFVAKLFLFNLIAPKRFNALKKGFHISAVNHANFTFTLLKKNVFAFFATKLENSDIRRQTSKSFERDKAKMNVITYKQAQNFFGAKKKLKTA